MHLGPEWVVSKQLLFGEDPEPAPGHANDLPLAYVASALSSLNEEGRKLVDAWCHAIKEAIAEASDVDKVPLIRCHAPVDLSAPWKSGGKTNEEIYDLNFTTVVESDALIVIGHQGGSFGGGQEIGWATDLRMPILYVHHTHDKVSRQLYGTPADIDFYQFSTTDDLAQRVRRFIKERRKRIEAHHRTRGHWRVVYVLPLARLRAGWRPLEEDGRRRVSALASLHPRQVDAILTSASTLAVTSLDALTALSSALGLSYGQVFEPSPLPELSSIEIQALRVAVREHGVDPTEAFQLEVEARLELAKGGTRRFSLTTPEDWICFRSNRR